MCFQLDFVKIGHGSCPAPVDYFYLLFRGEASAQLFMDALKALRSHNQYHHSKRSLWDLREIKFRPAPKTDTYSEYSKGFPASEQTRIAILVNDDLKHGIARMNMGNHQKQQTQAIFRSEAKAIRWLAETDNADH